MNPTNMSTAATCTACDKFQNAIEGSVTLAASVGAAVKRKSGSTFTDLFSFPLFVSGLFLDPSLLYALDPY